MKLSDVLGWVGVTLVLVPLFAGALLLVVAMCAEAPWPIGVGAVAAVVGFILISLALALE